MSEVTLEQKSVELLDKADQAIASFASNLTDLAAQYGPEVAEAALDVARIDAGSVLFKNLVLFLLALTAFATVTPRLWKWACKREDEAHTWDKGGPTCIFIVTTVPQTIILLASGAALLDIWRWVGVFRPELWIAKQILGL